MAEELIPIFLVWLNIRLDPTYNRPIYPLRGISLWRVNSCVYVFYTISLQQIIENLRFKLGTIVGNHGFRNSECVEEVVLQIFHHQISRELFDRFEKREFREMVECDKNSYMAGP